MKTVHLYSNSPDIRLRFAAEADVPLVLEFVRELAEYEHLLDKVTAAEEGLRKFLFEEKLAEAVICEYQGEPAGFALFFHNFSTFVGKPGIFIEDIFVKPVFRGRGLGKLLLENIAKIAVERDCGRLEWACLNWNEPSIAFYKAQGAEPLSEWTTYRLAGAGIGALARKLTSPADPLPAR